MDDHRRIPDQPWGDEQPYDLARPFAQDQFTMKRVTVQGAIRPTA
jgi:hypothetical protein